MSEAIEQGRRHLGVPEDGGPFAEAEVRRDGDAGSLIELAQQVEQQRPAGGAEWQVAKLIKDDEIGMNEPRCDLPGLALVLFRFERVDEFEREISLPVSRALSDSRSTSGEALDWARLKFPEWSGRGGERVNCVYGQVVRHSPVFRRSDLRLAADATIVVVRPGPPRTSFAKKERPCDATPHRDDPKPSVLTRLGIAT